MPTVTMVINGATVAGTVEPRTLLADYLRDTLHLTGTHIGCAQGVCGACTVLVDGAPQRACIAFAIQCEGRHITTIEGYDTDPIMTELRQAFSTHHALQCGFCTPGMLATARDIVVRLGEIPETRIREELSGNICRCTGYVGIVDAISAVCKGKAPQTGAAPALQTTIAKSEPLQTIPAAPKKPAGTTGSQSSEQRIRIDATPDTVWKTLADLRLVSTCLPGAEIETIDGNDITGRIRLALGPIKASFRGEASLDLDDIHKTGRLTGHGRDGGSAATGEVQWQVTPDGDAASLLTVTLSWRLTGPLAQFGRGGLVQDIVRRLTATFATNLEAVIHNRAIATKTPNLLALVWAWLTKRKRPGLCPGPTKGQGPFGNP